VSERQELRDLWFLLLRVYESYYRPAFLAMLLLLGHLRVERVGGFGGGCGTIVVHDIVIRNKPEVELQLPKFYAST